MSEEPFNWLIAIFATGLSVFLAGSLGFWIPRRRPSFRLIAAIGAALAIGLIATSIVPWKHALISACISMVTVVAVDRLESKRLAATVAAIGRFARRPTGQSTVLTALGAIAMIAAVVHLTRVEDATAERDMAWMLEASTNPDLVTAPNAATTDEGNLVTLRQPVAPRLENELDSIETHSFAHLFRGRQLTRVSPCDDASNCHGWVFTGGEYWIAAKDVERILAENHYLPISDPLSGDLVIYRNGSSIAHTALVQAALPNEPIVVVGKWGWMGVFRHRVDDCGFGAEHVFYRSHRKGHLLKGLRIKDDAQ